MERDTKSLYRKALLPENDPDKIWNLSGINDPYEVPELADLTIDTENTNPGDSADRLLHFVLSELHAIQAIST